VRASGAELVSVPVPSGLSFYVLHCLQVPHCKTPREARFLVNRVTFHSIPIRRYDYFTLKFLKA
jgi:hypothetical protein